MTEIVSDIGTTKTADQRTSREGRELRQWLEDFQQCVRTVDFKRGRTLFAPNVMAFGTYSAVIVGLDELERDQWKHIWPNIEGFTYRVDEMYFGVDGDVAWVACPWDSIRRAPDGTSVSRPGRVSVGLVKRKGKWLATHTHHSLYPQS